MNKRNKEYEWSDNKVFTRKQVNPERSINKNINKVAPSMSQKSLDSFLINYCQVSHFFLHNFFF